MPGGQVDANPLQAIPGVSISGPYNRDAPGPTNNETAEGWCPESIVVIEAVHC